MFLIFFNIFIYFILFYVFFAFNQVVCNADTFSLV